jgi:hypothetical protein
MILFLHVSAYTGHIKYMAYCSTGYGLTIHALKMATLTFKRGYFKNIFVHPLVRDVGMLELI